MEDGPEKGDWVRIRLWARTNDQSGWQTAFHKDGCNHAARAHGCVLAMHNALFCMVAAASDLKCICKWSGGAHVAGAVHGVAFCNMVCALPCAAVHQQART